MAMPVCSSRAAETITISLPLSKSIAARVMVALFWSGGCLDCLTLPGADDTRELHSALLQLKRTVEEGEENSSFLSDTEYYMGEGGTTMRFFLPVMASLPGVIGMIDCGEGQRRRPLMPLVNALRQVGACIKGGGTLESQPPFMVRGERLKGGEILLDASVSSQFISAIMLSAPMWREGAVVRLEGESVSYPYIRMTAEVMRRFGAQVSLGEDKVIVRPGGYTPSPLYEMESDWSAASYFYEYLLAAGDDTVVPDIYLPGLPMPEKSLQGDSRCAALMEISGISTEKRAEGVVIRRNDDFRDRMKKVRREGFRLNLSDTPDLVPALAVGCCAARIPYRFEGIGHLRHKECDRISALAIELNRLGYGVECGSDFIMYDPAADYHPKGERIEIATYGDHRMAMAFGILSVIDDNIIIKHPEVETKSFPGFRKEIAKL